MANLIGSLRGDVMKREEHVLPDVGDEGRVGADGLFEVGDDPVGCHRPGVVVRKS